jgi:hypothetical protein
MPVDYGYPWLCRKNRHSLCEGRTAGGATCPCSCHGKLRKTEPVSAAHDTEAETPKPTTRRRS